MYNILNNYDQFNTDFIQFIFYTIPDSIVWDSNVMPKNHMACVIEIQTYVQICSDHTLSFIKVIVSYLFLLPSIVLGKYCTCCSNYMNRSKKMFLSVVQDRMVQG